MTAREVPPLPGEGAGLRPGKPLLRLGLILLLGLPALWEGWYFAQLGMAAQLQHLRVGKADVPPAGSRFLLSAAIAGNPQAVCVKALGYPNHKYFLFRDGRLFRTGPGMTEPVYVAPFLRTVTFEDMVAMPDGSLALLTTSTCAMTQLPDGSWSLRVKAGGTRSEPDAQAIAQDYRKVVEDQDHPHSARIGCVSTLFTLTAPDAPGPVVPAFHSLVTARPYEERIKEAGLFLDREGGLFCIHPPILTGFDRGTARNTYALLPIFHLPAHGGRWAPQPDLARNPGLSDLDHVTYASSRALGFLAFNQQGLWSLHEDAPRGWVKLIGPGWESLQGGLSDTSWNDAMGYRLFAGASVWTQHENKIFRWTPGDAFWTATPLTHKQATDNAHLNGPRSNGGFGVDPQGNFHIGIHVLTPAGRWNDLETAMVERATGTLVAEADGTFTPVLDAYETVAHATAFASAQAFQTLGNHMAAGLFWLMMAGVVVGSGITAARIVFRKGGGPTPGKVVELVVLSGFFTVLIFVVCFIQELFRTGIR